MQFGRFMSSTRRLLVKMLSIGCKQRTTPTTPVVPNWRSIIPPSTSFHQIFLQFSSPFAPVWFSKRNNDDKIIHLEGGGRRRRSILKFSISLIRQRCHRPGEYGETSQHSVPSSKSTQRKAGGPNPPKEGIKKSSQTNFNLEI